MLLEYKLIMSTTRNNRLEMLYRILRYRQKDKDSICMVHLIVFCVESAQVCIYSKVTSMGIPAHIAELDSFLDYSTFILSRQLFYMLYPEI